MKKAISLITALLVSAVTCAAPVLGANAIWRDLDTIRDFCHNAPGTYVESDDGKNVECLLDLGDMFFQEKTYKNYSTAARYEFLPDYFKAYNMMYDEQTSRTYFNGRQVYLYSKYAKVSFTVPIESADKVNEYIKADEELSKYYNNVMLCVWKNDETSTYKYRIDLFGNNAYEKAREIKKSLQSITETEQFTFTPTVEEVRPLFAFFLRYCPNISYFSNGYGIEGVELEQIKETLENYVAENNLDYTVELYKGNMMHGISFGGIDEDFYGYDLVPNGEVDYAEQIELSKKIYVDLGYNSWYSYDGTESGSEGGTYSSESIDMSNNVNGDANCDGEYTIADSTAILQALGNPDKYGLSLQGEFNADICNVGDGVTTMDALEVQKAMASKG